MAERQRHQEDNQRNRATGSKHEQIMTHQAGSVCETPAAVTDSPKAVKKQEGETAKANK
jgi:hypothetical protein